MNYEKLIHKNRLYENNIHRWEYYYNSYFGGQDYQRSGYLRKYLAEENDGFNEYAKRLASTPLDNHCRNVIDTYTSFIWRDSPQREFGILADNPALELFLRDADLEGRSFNAVMREATTLANIYGHVLLMLDKPASEAATLAEELAQGIRPYLTTITPENIMDWTWERKYNGRYAITMLKLKEYEDEEKCVYRIWKNDTVSVYEADNDAGDMRLVEEHENAMGHIPAVFLYGQRSHERGIGISQIADIADVQKAIYNELSELEQVIRLSNHPTIVTTEGVDLMGGAGSVITIEDRDIDPALKPYMLQANSQSISSILQAIETKTQMIDRMANLSSMRSTSKATASGVSLKIERELLNVKLAQIADNLEICEENLFHHFVHFYDSSAHFDGVIDYPDNFDMTDTYTELDFLMKASAAPVSSSAYQTEISKQIARLVIEDEEQMDAIITEIENGSQAPEFGTNLDVGTTTQQDS